MSVEHVEVLVEELSMEAALRVLLPRLLGDVSFEVYPHQGKQDLLARLPARLRGYANWLPPSHRVVVVIDRDNEDCEELKSQLDKIAAEAGLVTRASSKERPWAVVNRIAIEELEAWYFGDWAAVRAAYPAVHANVGTQAAYRKSDEIVGAWETFERVMQGFRYFGGGLRKIEAARAIAAHMDPDRNRSPSFCALRDALREIAGEAT